jgi:hypothetical protein
MVELDIFLLYLLYRPLECLFPVTTVEGPKHSHRRGVRGIIYACSVLSHTDYCGTRRTESPIRAS